MGLQMHQIDHYINGSSLAAGDRTAPIFDPGTGVQTGQVSLADQGEVDRAVAAAAEAFQSWGRSSLSTRQRIMFAFRELVAAHRQELAELVSAEHGKTIDDALGEVQRGLEVVEFACNIPHLLKGDFSEQVSTSVDTYSVRQPLGVVAGITPFNFPAMVPMWMYPVAIACGNTFVLKPSEKDPSVSMLAARLFTEAGLPDGVFNVLNGDATAVNGLLTHPDVAAVSFVGSTPIAQHIHETASAHGKRALALGGAKNHMVVLPDADLGDAADAAVSAGFGSAGERCMAISVVVAVGDIADDLVDAIAKRVREIRVGPGQDPRTEMGPLVTSQHLGRVRSYVDGGEAAGATLVVDGRDVAVDDCPDGFYLGPTLFDHVDTSMDLYTDEIFGPVLSIVRAATYGDAIELVNRNPYGNGTALFTRDGGAARRFQQEIEVGMVGINIPIPVPLSYYSFGGWKQSAFGAHAIYGPDGVHFYTRQKVMITKWSSTGPASVDFRFPAG